MPTLPLLSLLQVLVLLLLLAPLSCRGGGGMGVNWGTISTHLLPPSVVVRMLKANNLSKVKLFDANPDCLLALAGTDIEVMVGISNDFLQMLSASPSAADQWVHDNVTRYMGKGGVNIKYVAVGNEPFLTFYEGRYQAYTYPALNNIHQSLVRAGLGDLVKVTVPCNGDVIESSLVPSKGNFRPELKVVMTQIVTLLNSIDAPILINIYPFINLVQQKDFPEDYAFFDGSLHNVTDGRVVYSNSLDANFDTLIVALGGIGFPNIRVVIGEIGWPSDGAFYANLTLAQKFNQGLINHVRSGRGTPLRPGIVIETYLFGLLDEDEKSTLPGDFERHWGIFSFDGQAKYHLDLSGQGSTTTLVNAENVPYLPSRWCIAKPNSNLSLLPSLLDVACATADCTALVDGGSCNDIGIQESASYALNNYYQMSKQDPASCAFNGFGLITFVDPSIGNCRFLIGVSCSTLCFPNAIMTSVVVLIGFSLSSLLLFF